MAQVIEYRGKVYIAKNVKAFPHGGIAFEAWSREKCRWVRGAGAGDNSFPSVAVAQAFLQAAIEIVPAVRDADVAFVQGTEGEQTFTIDKLKDAVLIAFLRQGIHVEKPLNEIRGWFDDSRFHSYLYAPEIGTDRLASAFIVEDRVLTAEGEPSFCSAEAEQ